MGSELSMATKHDITRKFAREYLAASKTMKGTLLDEVCSITGWSRDNARRQLRNAAKPRPVGVKKRAPRSRKYSYDAVKVLQFVWATTGGMNGKYLHQSMRLQLDLLEAHGELSAGKKRYSPDIRAQLLNMSSATIDRYLAPTKKRLPLFGIAATSPSPLLRNSISIRKAGDEVEQVPGFFEGDTVAHCGPVLKGEFARTFNLTCMHTGWVYTHSVRNNAHIHIRTALDAAIDNIPFEVTGMDFDNGSEFINHDVIQWAKDLDIYFTRSRPYKKNDQATVESKNYHLVRKYAFYWRYDTPETLALLQQLWPLVNDRFNYLTPTRKPVGWSTDSQGRRKRMYDTPQTPFDRLLGSNLLAKEQETVMVAYRDRLNPAKIARAIDRIQQRLTLHAKQKTQHLITELTPVLPDVNKGIKPRPERKVG